MLPVVHAAESAFTRIHVCPDSPGGTHKPCPVSRAAVHLSFRMLTARWVAARSPRRAGVDPVTARPPVFRDLREQPARLAPPQRVERLRSSLAKET